MSSVFLKFRLGLGFGLAPFSASIVRGLSSSTPPSHGHKPWQDAPASDGPAFLTGSDTSYYKL